MANETLNTSLLDNATNIQEIVEGINYASGNVLVPVLLLVIWVISMIVFKNYDTKFVAFTSSLIVTGASVFCWWLEWMNVEWIILPAAFAFASAIWIATDN